ncbi:hypothetical protein ACLOJK_038241 [Asimina triloba]
MAADVNGVGWELWVTMGALKTMQLPDENGAPQWPTMVSLIRLGGFATVCRIRGAHVVHDQAVLIDPDAIAGCATVSPSIAHCCSPSPVSTAIAASLPFDGAAIVGRSSPELLMEIGTTLPVVRIDGGDDAVEKDGGGSTVAADAQINLIGIGCKNRWMTMLPLRFGMDTDQGWGYALSWRGRRCRRSMDPAGGVRSRQIFRQLVGAVDSDRLDHPLEHLPVMGCQS